ncbi:hypothetical protein BDV96DRAFT_642659 [Lophiotrema nucula]|uniref:Uncharacterized protein n=1 Tax=Lophiotrema nucula TaxID=690887 RepID=A0A6A5ZLA7_9PLEO|nr:hypothetical protein BDV96DRAFT_642659 [Lophiotrema nucula]
MKLTDNIIFTFLLGFVGATAASIAASNEALASTTSLVIPSSTTPTYPSGPPPEIFPSRIPDIPEDDFECWTSQISWSSLSTQIQYADETEYRQFKRTLRSYTTSSYLSQATFGPEPDKILCDGYKRVTGQATPTRTDIYTTFVVNSPSVSTFYPPKPTCTIDSYGSVCSKAYVSETSIVDRIKSAGYTTDFPLDNPYDITSILKPPCETLYTYITTPTAVTCSLDKNLLQYKVLYWPVQTAGNFCAPGNVSHVTVEPTQTISGLPNTARYKDLVMTSPTVYYMLDNAQMHTFAGMTSYTRYSAFTPLGTPVGHITMSQDPRVTPLSSAITDFKPHGGRHGWYEPITLKAPFQLEDLNTVPYSHYSGPSVTYYGASGTIYQGLFTPLYTFPPGVQSKNRQWEVCDTMVLGDVYPSYIALPTESFQERNTPWTHTWSEAALPTPSDNGDTDDGNKVEAIPGTGVGAEGPVVTEAV